MAGIEVSEEMTNDQLLAMCGGELLRQEVNRHLCLYSKSVCPSSCNPTHHEFCLQWRRVVSRGSTTHMHTWMIGPWLAVY